jgi:caffeoyl-CoA O-methyltransferase
VNKTFGQSDPRLEEHVYRVFSPEDDFLCDVRARQQAAGLPAIQVGLLDGLHLEVLTRAVGARRVVEVGTLGGYSGVCLLRGMVPGGVLYTVEYDAKHAAFARETFARAGLAERAQVLVGDARTVLPTLGERGPFDLVFIDADKVGYPEYVAWAGENLRMGGVVLCDNAFLFGRVADEPTGEYADEIRAMRRCHDALARGGRFRSTLIPTGEGLAMGVKVA